MISATLSSTGFIAALNPNSNRAHSASLDPAAEIVTCRNTFRLQNVRTLCDS